MRQDEYLYNLTFCAPATRSQSSPPPFFPEPNVPGEPGEGPSSGVRYDVPRSGAIYSSSTNGVTHEDVYPQLPRSSPHGLGSGHGVYQKHPPIPRSPRPTAQQPYPVRGPAYAAHTPHLSDVLHQQNPASLIATGSHYQGFAVQDALGRPHYQKWTSDYADFSSPAGSFLHLPDQPQNFNLTDDHHLSLSLAPLMPVAQPYRWRTGRRRALIIGINYSSHPDPAFHLKHAVDDAYGMANFLRDNLGFARDEVRIMTDESSPWNLPTKENILRELAALVYDAQPHDSLFFYYSGHAFQIEDTDGDELDGFDESICAMDYIGDDPSPTPDTPGIVVDDVMHDIMVKSLPPQCRLTAIFDSCHSGTLLDLPHIYDSNGIVKEFLHPNRLAVLRAKSSNAHVISLSASRDYEVALETSLGGVLRSAFMDCLHAFRYKVTYKQLIWNVREYMKFNGFPQRPQLSSSHEIDTNLWFVI